MDAARCIDVGRQDSTHAQLEVAVGSKIQRTGRSLLAKRRLIRVGEGAVDADVLVGHLYRADENLLSRLPKTISQPQSLILKLLKLFISIHSIALQQVQ